MAEYLEPKNWQKFQPLRGKGRYIFDYTQQDDDPDLCKLSMFQRAVLQDIRRIRGRIGKSVPYDTQYIMSAMSATVEDRPRIPRAIAELVVKGLLVVMNQAVNTLQRGDIENENDKDIKPTARKAKRPNEPTDPRFHHCVDILHRYWDKFVKGKVRFELWMDKAGYRNLKNVLKKHDSMTVEEFTIFVANRARSPGVNHLQPVFEWLGHIMDWAGGPKGNGNGSGKLTEQQSRAGTSAAVAAAVGKVFGRTDAVGGEHVPNAVTPDSGNTG